MDWYYDKKGRQAGPIAEPEINVLVKEGKIKADTQVWREGMANWLPYAAIVRSDAQNKPIEARAKALSVIAECAECAETFTTSEMIRLGASWVCTECKPIFAQKTMGGKEVISRATAYGGIWNRFGAKLMDGFILGVMNVTMVTVGSAFFAGSKSMALVFTLQFIQFAVNIAYITLFLGRFGATPGKMACGLTVVTAEGGRMSYARALGRCFAELLSGLILSIGYILALFDDRKRTLHDHICNTRVVKKEAAKQAEPALLQEIQGSAASVDRPCI